MLHHLAQTNLLTVTDPDQQSNHGSSCCRNENCSANFVYDPPLEINKYTKSHYHNLIVCLSQERLLHLFPCALPYFYLLENSIFDVIIATARPCKLTKKDDLPEWLYSTQVGKYSLLSRSIGTNAVYLLKMLQALLVWMA